MCLCGVGFGYPARTVRIRSSFSLLAVESYKSGSVSFLGYVWYFMIILVSWICSLNTIFVVWHHLQHQTSVDACENAGPVTVACVTLFSIFGFPVSAPPIVNEFVNREVTQLV